MTFLAHTPEPPYFAVIFSVKYSGQDSEAYGIMADRMFELVKEQPGFLGVESVHNAEGEGITVSYWESLESIKAWKREEEHKQAQKKGYETWYSEYHLRIAHVETAYGANDL